MIVLSFSSVWGGASKPMLLQTKRELLGFARISRLLLDGRSAQNDSLATKNRGSSSAALVLECGGPTPLWVFGWGRVSPQKRKIQTSKAASGRRTPKVGTAIAQFPHEFDDAFVRRSTMAKTKDQAPARPTSPKGPVPPGATRKAFEREDNGGGTPGSPPGDRHAAGTPGGGTEFGGLAGTNIGEGSPENADLERPMGTGVPEEDIEEEGPPYAGPSGGAVGGTPAQGRSSGGRVHRGIAPEGTHRGDSTIGGDPERGSEGS
jgi:hypothetical protein